VDTDLKTAIDNLYVCDCSVMPEAWGLPPTFSLIALGKRLAKHLAGGSVRQGEAVKGPAGEVNQIHAFGSR